MASSAKAGEVPAEAAGAAAVPANEAQANEAQASEVQASGVSAGEGQAVEGQAGSEQASEARPGYVPARKAPVRAAAGDSAPGAAMPARAGRARAAPAALAPGKAGAGRRRERAPDALAPLLAPGARALRQGALLSSLAALVWVPQAALVAMAIGGLLGGQALPIWLAVGGFAGLGALRAALGWLAEARLHGAAEAVVSAARQKILARLAGQSAGPGPAAAAPDFPARAPGGGAAGIVAANRDGAAGADTPASPQLHGAAGAAGYAPVSASCEAPGVSELPRVSELPGVSALRGVSDLPGVSEGPGVPDMPAGAGATAIPAAAVPQSGVVSADVRTAAARIAPLVAGPIAAGPDGTPGDGVRPPGQPAEVPPALADAPGSRAGAVAAPAGGGLSGGAAAPGAGFPGAGSSGTGAQGAGSQGTGSQGAGSRGAGALAALAGEKLELIGNHVIRYAPARARVMLVPPVILALAFWHSWAVGLILLISGPLIPVFMALVGIAAKQASARQLSEVGALNDLLVERLSAMADIRLLGAGETVLRGFARAGMGLRQRTMAVLRIAFLSSTVLELFSAIGIAMVAVWTGFTLLGQLSIGSWGGAITPAAGIFLLLLAPEYYQPLRDLAAAWHDRAAAAAVADEIAAFEAAPPEPLPGLGAPAMRLQGPAEVALIGCALPGRGPLPDIHIREGETVALIGPSGSGKTSVLRLMAGLVLPEQGCVQVAGQRLDARTADSWRARLGWMPQAPHFLNDSLGGNLAMGRSGDVGAALRGAAAQALVSALPQGLATRLGETGGGLSGGEARRLTLARAILAAPDLILADEPTADLDAATAEAVAQGLLAEAARGATLIIATHDPALAARMGRVIRLGEAA